MCVPKVLIKPLQVHAPADCPLTPHSPGTCALAAAAWLPSPLSLPSPLLLSPPRVTIGCRVLFGPNVQIYAATHPLDGAVRQGTAGPEYGRPISIGDDVWVGGAAVICPGVSIGEGAVVGAGSVVTRDVEAFTVVAGNPARVIRRLERQPAAAAAAGGEQQQPQPGAELQN